MIDTSAYMLKISQASPAGLVVINFEIALDFLRAAEAAQSADERGTAIQKAKDAIDELISALDFEVEIARDFYEIYQYCFKLLSDVRFSSDTEAACSAVKEVAELMEILLVGWRDTAQKADTYVASEAPKVYTGLTYGRDGNANEYIEENTDRSYMA